jgi:3-deoxy-manno-octulosonate cytidylyltransferase (CMP-KDO synthetase)
MQILGVIPARFSSTRFPGKPLVDIAGKSMIQRVYEQAKKASTLDDVIVATDDQRILDHVTGFGGKVLITADTHQSGTDRCAEVAERMPGFDAVINIQGDEPYIDPLQINLLAGCFDKEDTLLATLVKKIGTKEELNNPNIPKVVLNLKSEAIYFSRAAIPYLRGVENNWENHHTYYKHIGIYGYRSSILNTISKLPVSILEKSEALEQLRWIENGYKIRVAITDLETIAIDTPEDLQRLLTTMGQYPGSSKTI